MNVRKNVLKVMGTQSFIDSRKLDNERWLPPSNNINVNAIALSKGPTYPKSWGLRNPKMGPTKIHINLSGRTSGILVFSNSDVKKCAAKIISPTENTNVEMVSINY